MSRRVSVLVPTRKRLASLGRTLGTFEATVLDPASAEIVLRCDNDDPETIDFLRRFPHRFIVGPRHDGYKSLPAFFNDMAAVADGDVLLCGNDDMEFRTPDWPRIVLEAAAAYPDGVFNFGVNVGLNDDKFPFSIVSRRMVQALGFINDERLLFSDVFLLDVARAFNRAVRLSAVTIVHDWAGVVADETRRDANRHEVSMVFRDETGAWTDEYRQKHETAVREAVAAIGRATRQRIGVAAHQSAGTADDAQAEIAHVVDEVARLGIPAGLAVVTSAVPSRPPALWRQAFGQVLAIHRDPEVAPPPPSDHVTVLSGDPGQTRFLYTVLEQLENLRALVIDDRHYATAMSTYYLLGARIERPGIVVFLPMSPAQAGDAGVRRLVADLRSGAADNRRHVIADVPPTPGGPGLSYELFL